MTGGFTIRYRRTTTAGLTALIVEDRCGAAYLFTAGALQARTSAGQPAETLVRLLGGHAHWDTVPRVAPYSIEGLCEITGGKRTSPPRPTSHATPGRHLSIGRLPLVTYFDGTRYSE
jgi:hypothetical protein